MKKVVATLLMLALCLSMGSVAFGEGMTFRTVSTFAGTDASAPQYQELLSEWEEETGNTVDDYSAESDEAWKTSVLNDFAAGNEPDVLFYFAASADSQSILDKVVPISEINEAYPELDFPEAEALREDDGKVYAIPVRSFWEGLFCNVDIFEEYGLELPTDKEKFEIAVQTLKENDVVPMAISLSDIPHYITDFAILACGTVEDHRARPKTVEEMPESWVAGNELIHTLYEMGAFPVNVNSTTESLTTNMFLEKQAAMLLDGSWRANGVPQENWDTTVVMPFPAFSDDADPTATIGGTSMGFYITRKTWDDPERRDAAVSLLKKLTDEHANEVLGFSFGGELLKSARIMVDAANANDSLCSPIGDAIDPEIRKTLWYDKVPGIADGTEDPKVVMDGVIEAGVFQ